MFSTNLKALIKEKGITQKELAEATDVKQNTVSDWINQGNSPKLEHLCRISEFLDVNIHWLITGSGEKYISDEHSEIEGFSNEECQLVYDWRELSERRKGRVEIFLQTQLEEQNAEDAKKVSVTG